MAHQARDLGADALLVGPPYVQSDAAIAGYYRRVVNAVDLPMIVHDYPAGTGITMTPDLIAEIRRSGEWVRYVKLEDPPTGEKMERVWEQAGRELQIFGAYGGIFALEELERGAVGIMTGFAYPELLVELYRRHREGDADGAARVFYDFVPLVRLEFQPGIGVHLRKEILVRRGVFETATVRHPGAVADQTTIDQLLRVVDHLRAKGYELDP
jgi:4-hydroxy-tetrahydrodipicolinate synthase